MRRDRARVLLAVALLLGSFALPSLAMANPCALEADPVQLAQVEGESGMGGSGFGDEGSGMGGSGAVDESGIGGSGLLGTITGFASVCVNGVEVQLASGTPVERFGRSASTAELAVGQVVWIEATARGGQLHAEHISVLTAVAGSVEQVDPEGAQLRIGGEWIALAPDAELYDAIEGGPTGLDAFGTGEFAVISGLPGPDGRIIASRVERWTAQSGARADLVPLAELLQDSPQVRVVWVEGHLTLREADGGVQLSGTDLDFVRPSDVSSELPLDTRVVLSGRVDTSGSVEVDSVLVRPQRSAPVRPESIDRSLPLESPQHSPDAGPTGGVERSPTGRPQRAAPSDRPDLRPERSDRPERPDRPQRPERPERPDIGTAVDRL